MKNFVAFFIVIAMFSCSKDSSLDPTTENISLLDKYSESLDTWEDMIVASGVPQKSIIREKAGFLIEGRMLVGYDHFALNHDEYRERLKTKNLDKLRATKCETPLKDCSLSKPSIRRIFLYVDSSVPPSWRSALEYAIFQWNYLPTNAFNFSITDNYCSSSSDNTRGIKVQTTNLPLGDPTSVNIIPGSWFFGRKVPEFLFVNTASPIYTGSTNQKRSAMMRALGYSLGFKAPVPDFGGFATWGTCLVYGDDNQASIMDPNNFFPQFTSSDIAGIPEVYPNVADIRSTAQCIQQFGHCGNLVGCNTCPSGWTFDGANCYSGIHVPSGRTPFQYGRGFYINPEFDFNTFTLCPDGWTYDGSNCFSGKYIPGDATPFVYNNTLYVQPYCD